MERAAQALKSPARRTAAGRNLSGLLEVGRARDLLANDEYREVIFRPEFDRYVSVERRQKILDIVAVAAERMLFGITRVFFCTGNDRADAQDRLSGWQPARWCVHWLGWVQKEPVKQSRNYAPNCPHPN